MSYNALWCKNIHSKCRKIFVSIFNRNSISDELFGECELALRAESCEYEFHRHWSDCRKSSQIKNIELFLWKDELKLMVVALVLWACSLAYSAYFAVQIILDGLHNTNTQYWPIYICILMIVLSLYAVAVFSYIFVWQYILDMRSKNTNHPLTNVLNDIRRDSKYNKQWPTAVISWESLHCVSIEIVSIECDEWILLRNFCIRLNSQRQFYNNRSQKASHWNSNCVVFYSFPFHIHSFQVCVCFCFFSLDFFPRYLYRSHSLVLPIQMLWRTIRVKCVQSAI